MFPKIAGNIRSLLSTAKNRYILRSNLYISRLTLGQAVVVGSVLVSVLVLGIKQLGSLQLLELAAYDRMVRLQPDTKPDPRLLIVAITEKDIQEQKRWPISDRTLAEVLQKLQHDRPKVIGLDLHRDLAQPPGREELKQQLQAFNIITITELGDNSEGVPPIPGIPEERIGFNDIVIDPDEVVRRNFMYAHQGQQQFYSFSLRMSLQYLKNRGMSLDVKRDALKLGKTVFVPLDPNSGGYHNVDALGYQVLLSYRKPEHLAQQVTLTQVLNGQVNPAWVKDKVVLIGTTAPSLKDLFFTPYSAAQKAKPGMPGVQLHAELVSQILSTVLDGKPLFWFFPQWGEALWVWAWALVGGLLAWRLQHPLFLGLAGIVALGGLWGIYFVIFTQAGWIPLISPAIALLATGGSIVAYKLLHNALHDSLTGLPNRDFFLKRLKGAIADTKVRKNALFAVFFLDLDRFNVVNNTLGLEIGEQLLINTTKRLKTCLRSKDILAKVGGDEFAILIEHISNASEATSIADKVQQEMILPFNLKGQEIFTSVSIGIALNQAEHDYQPEALLRDAHTAMYRAKALGKSRHEIFATGMRVQIVKRLQLETDLRLAIEQHEFQLHYQPVVSLKTGKMAGFEALVRWQHPQKGLVSPAEFIPVTEETGLIIPLGQWIFQEACRQLYIWQEQFPTEPPLKISVNLSAQQFSQPNLVEEIEETLKKTGLDASNLKLEITESIAMNDVESAIAMLLRLKGLNLQLSIDDFGTGYSSLSYLHRFPVDTLKVDRSFVSHMEDSSEDEAIVQTIIILSHNLGMDVIAEGVETAAQRKKLQDLHCEYGQGYFFSKPLPAEAATALLSRNPQWD